MLRPSATTPAASGAAALVPPCEAVQRLTPFQATSVVWMWSPLPEDQLVAMMAEHISEYHGCCPSRSTAAMVIE